MSGAVWCGLREATGQGDKKFIESSFWGSERAGAFVPLLPLGIQIVWTMMGGSPLHEEN